MEVELPDKIVGALYPPARYKVLHGGRGGAKSWGIARMLLIKGKQASLRIPCCREFQKSIQDSVHQLLKNQIEDMGLGWFYKITDTYIEGRNGTMFTFHGLKHNVNNIKSLEGADIVWVEEAANVSKNSWDTLIPTVRKEGSEIWISFNPELESDETYKRFVLNPPPNAVVVQINWPDNPWFPSVLREEKDTLKARSLDDYLHVWEGQIKQALEGAIYAAELRAARLEQRITRVPYDASLPVYRFWDLGWADNTSIWLAQFVGLDVRVIRHVSGSRRKISDYLSEMQGYGYVYDEDWLPHDGEHGNVASEGRSVADILRSASCTVRSVPRTKNVVADIDKVRTLFPRLMFDEKNCADGLQSLSRYCWDTDDDGNTRGRHPKHDANSHDADALRTLAGAIDSVSIGRRSERTRRERNWRTA